MPSWESKWGSMWRMVSIMRALSAFLTGREWVFNGISYTPNWGPNPHGPGTPLRIGRSRTLYPPSATPECRKTATLTLRSGRFSTLSDNPASLTPGIARGRSTGTPLAYLQVAPDDVFGP